MSPLPCAEDCQQVSQVEVGGPVSDLPDVVVLDIVRFQNDRCAFEEMGIATSFLKIRCLIPGVAR